MSRTAVAEAPRLVSDLILKYDAWAYERIPLSLYHVMRFRLDFWEKHLGDFDANAITPTDVEHALKEHLKQGEHGAEINRRRALMLKTLVAWGLDRRLLHTNPFDGWKKYDMPGTTPKHLGISEVKSIIAKLSRQDHKDLVQWVMLTSLPAVMALDTKWTDIKKPQWRCIRDRQTGKTLHVALKKEEIEFLDTLPRELGDGGQWLFPNVNYGGFLHAFHVAADELDMEGVGLDDVRRVMLWRRM